MLKKTMQTIGITLLSVFLLASCSASKQEQETTPHYIPAEEWAGLETVTYDPEYAICVSFWETGSPDPEDHTMPEGFYTPRTEVIEFRTKKPTYSLSEDETVELVITNVASEDPQKNVRYAHFHPRINLERWNGTEWERMISTQFWRLPSYESEKQSLESGETEEESLSLHRVITVLTPGKYRAIAYINYFPVYAEFELVE